MYGSSRLEAWETHASSITQLVWLHEDVCTHTHTQRHRHTHIYEIIIVVTLQDYCEEYMLSCRDVINYLSDVIAIAVM